MKKLITIIFLFTSIHCFSQKRERYFQVMYNGQDSVHNGFIYGTYFFETINNYYPEKKDIYDLVVNNYKIRCRKNAFAFVLIEFKNKSEYLKMNTKE